jgi:TolB protein
MEIYVVNADGSGLRRLTRMRWSDEFPSWSPDGRMIAFASDRPSGGGVIYVMNADGSDLRTLNGRSASDAAWSPDGRTIALTQHDGDFEVYLPG